MSLQGQANLCVACQSFFGNETMLNMCSMCFKAHQEKLKRDAREGGETAAAAPAAGAGATGGAAAGAGTGAGAGAGPAGMHTSPLMGVPELKVESSPHSTSAAIAIPGRGGPQGQQQQQAYSASDAMACSPAAAGSVDGGAGHGGGGGLGVASSLPTGSPVGSLGSSPGRSSAPRCNSCNKRLGLTGFKCRCENYYCPVHRHANSHNCTFDYKSFGRDKIAKANPTVVGSKIDKI